MKEKKDLKSTEKVGAKTRRRDSRYPALIPTLNLKSRQEELFDLASYADSLPEEAKDWLNRFAEEEINVNYNHPGPKLNELTNLPKDQRSQEEILTRRRLDLRNNARNRCIYTREYSQGALNYLADLKLDQEYDDNDGWIEFEGSSEDEIKEVDEEINGSIGEVVDEDE